MAKNPTTSRKRSGGGPSIREIARQAGVSASTVSRVLNGRDTRIPIAEQTRQEVLDACRTLRYQPNIHAQRLFAGRSNSVAVMIPPHGGVLPGAASYTDPNLATTLAGMLDAATDRGQHLVLVASDPRVLESGDHLNLFRNRSIDGMLIWGAIESDWAYLSQLREEGHPFVLVNGCVRDEQVPYVSVDNRRGGQALAEHLIALGHRRIAFLAGPETASMGVARREAFVEVCRVAGAELTVVPGEFEFESGRQRAADLLAGSRRPTAIAAVDDLVAMGVMEAAATCGLRVPEDLSVTGADDAFAYYKPRLTTFHTPMEELGRRAIGLLLDLLDDDQAWHGMLRSNTHIVQGRLVLGQTTGPPPKEGFDGGK